MTRPNFQLGNSKSKFLCPFGFWFSHYLKQREDKVPAESKPRIRETLQTLVQLYEETNRPDQAAEWKKKLAEEAKALLGSQTNTPAEKEP